MSMYKRYRYIYLTTRSYDTSVYILLTHSTDGKFFMNAVKIETFAKRVVQWRVYKVLKGWSETIFPDPLLKNLRHLTNLVTSF